MSLAETSDILLIANKRKPNFTEGESLYLITQFERHKVILTSKLNDSTTNKQKVELWKRICNDYNSKNPVVLRTANELKRKWKNMVGAAKKELLELKGGAFDTGDSMTARKLSLTSERIIEILKISERNCKPSASPGTSLLNSLDGTFMEDQATPMSGDEDMSVREHTPKVLSVLESRDVKPEAVERPGQINGVVTETSQDSNNRESLFTLDSLTPGEGGLMRSQDDMVNSPAGVINVVFQESPASTSAVTTTSELRQAPRESRQRVRVSVPQKRMLSSPLAHVIKKRRCADEGVAHVRLEVEMLKKEKLVMEKEKLALEQEKLVMEKEKLALEIQFLKEQMD